MNIHLQEHSEEFRLTLDRKLFKATFRESEKRTWKMCRHSLIWRGISPYLDQPLCGQQPLLDLQILQHLLMFLYSPLSSLQWPFHLPFLVFSSHSQVWPPFWQAGYCQEKEDVPEQRTLWRNQVKLPAWVCQAKKAKTLMHACVTTKSDNHYETRSAGHHLHITSTSAIAKYRTTSLFLCYQAELLEQAISFHAKCFSLQLSRSVSTDPAKREESKYILHFTPFLKQHQFLFLKAVPSFFCCREKKSIPPNKFALIFRWRLTCN